MVIWHISDSHGYHGLLSLPHPDKIDMVVFTGDCGNSREGYISNNEIRDFIDWFDNLPYKHLIWIAGNHDTAIERKLVIPEEECKRAVYLQDQETSIGALKIYGSPWTPTYGNWSFMRKRGKLSPTWDLIPENLDILVTHGPPRGILDLSINKETNDFEQCGDKELLNAIEIKKPKLVLFGHIHNYKGCINQGIFKSAALGITFSNGSIVEDGKFGSLTSNGNIIEI